MDRKKSRRIKRTIKRTNDDGEEVEEVVEEIVEEIVEPEEQFFVDEDEINIRDDSPTDVDLTEELLKPEHPHIVNDNPINEVNQPASSQSSQIDAENNLVNDKNSQESDIQENGKVAEPRHITIKKPNKIIKAKGELESQIIDRPEAPAMQNVVKVHAPETPEPLPDITLIGKIDGSSKLCFAVPIFVAVKQLQYMYFFYLSFS